MGFRSSRAWIVGSNLTRRTAVCARVNRGLATGRQLVLGVLPTVEKEFRNSDARSQDTRVKRPVAIPKLHVSVLTI